MIPLSARAQEQQPQAPHTIRVDVELVLLNVSVRNPNNQPVADLKISDFTVYEDGVPQEISYFEQENSPLGVVLLMDVSSSMEGTPLREAKRAAVEFIRQTHPMSEMALLAFNDRVRTVQAFTSERERLQSAIDNLEASGGTALYDALNAAVDLVRTSRHAHRAVLLLSDGKDEDSSRKFAAVEQLVMSSDLSLFAVGEYSPAERKLYLTGSQYYKEPALDVNLSPVWVLRRLAEVSGGDSFFPQPQESLSSVFSRIAQDLQHQYVLGFSPKSASTGGPFHKIEVRVGSQGYPGPLKVRTRQGYVSR